ncbi:MAG: fluoride efflux transporter CrcB [Lewinellaceae bacterium]|nr:fluoride efflux transporter CrcB [Phaeodactylibacter sp.]MCB9347092.1 fluoride efflux transporter CrcB [Lewinellaceae bacterium]
MTAYALVFLGGGLGSVCRYGIAHLLAQYHLTFPLATFVANALSCILLGLLAGLSLRGQVSDTYKFMLMTGFCGGFSTFSTFTNETLSLLQAGHLGLGLLNIGGSLLLCLGCIYIGIRVGM